MFVVKFPVAEMAVFASVVMVLANLVLLFWRKDFARFHGEAVSPWSREFAEYFIVSAACGVGGYFFLQGDQLVAQRYFAPTDRDAYAAAERLAIALPMTVGPLLTFCSPTVPAARPATVGGNNPGCSAFMPPAWSAARLV